MEAILATMQSEHADTVSDLHATMDRLLKVGNSSSALCFSAS